MPSAFHGIYSASSALRAFQRAIDVTGHNIANVNTRGYSRQTVDLTPREGITFWQQGIKVVGSGVSITSINRIRDVLLDRSASKNLSQLGYAETMAQNLDAASSVYGEPSEDGIASALGKFFDAFAALGSDPSKSANRIQARQAADTLASRIRSAAEGLQDLEASIKEAAGSDFARANDLIRQISDLNREIVEAKGGGGAPNDMLDARQNALDDLSKLMKLETFEHASGAIVVSSGGLALVEVAGYSEMPEALNPASLVFDPVQAGTAFRSGSLKGHVESLAEVGRQQASLDDLANQLRTSVNGLSTTAVTLSGQTGISLFDPAGVGALSLDLSAEVKASADAIGAGTSGLPGDGGVARAISELRSSGMAALAGKTFEDYFGDAVAALGADASAAIAMADSEGLVSQQIEAQRQAVSGVNLDEEFADMIRLQRSYQAAARTLNVADQMTEELLGLIR